MVCAKMENSKGFSNTVLSDDFTIDLYSKANFEVGFSLCFFAEWNAPHFYPVDISEI